MASVGTVLRKRLGQFIAGRNPTPRPRPFGEMGTSGTAVHGGYVQVKERSPQWIGRQKYITSSELAINTSIVAAGVHYFLNLVAYPKWTFRATDEDDEEALALAEFADNVINDMDTPWYKVVRRAAMYRFHGFGIQEWTAKHRDDGLIGLKDVEARPQQTIEQWDVDIDGSVLGVWQRSPQTGAMLGIPRDKVLYLVEDTLTDSPEGLGMFRHMADPYQRLKQMQELEIRAFERDLRGTPIARAPLTMLDRAVQQNVITQAEVDRMVLDFESLVKLQVKQSDTGIVMDSLPYFSDSDAGDQVSTLPQWSFELLSGGGVGHAEVAAGIERLQREIARLIGVEGMMMGGDASGNRSLGEDKNRTLYLVTNSVLKYIASKVKSDILVPVWKLNGFPMKKMPLPKPEDVTFKNVDAITAAIQKMAAAGSPLSPNDPVVNDVRDLLGVSRVPDDVMAEGAAAQPNPMLAGLPPQLQLAALGGKGQRPINLGSGSPGKQPGMGGGGLPGTGGLDPTKKFVKEDPENVRRKPIRDPDEEPADGDRQAIRTRIGSQREVGVDEAGRRDSRAPQEVLANGSGKPIDRRYLAGDDKAGLGTPGDLNEDEAPIEDPTNPGHIDIAHERAKVRETVDEPPQVQQAVLGSATPLRPDDPKPGLAEDGGKPTKTVLAEGAGGPAAGSGGGGQPTIGGIPVESKGHGKVEVDAKLLVRVLERLTGGPAAEEGQPKPAGTTDELQGKPEAALDAAVDASDKPTPAIGARVAGAGRDSNLADQAVEGEAPAAKPMDAEAAAALTGKPPQSVEGKPVDPAQLAAAAQGKPLAPAATPKSPVGPTPAVPGKPQPGEVPAQAPAVGGIPGAPDGAKAGAPPMKPGAPAVPGAPGAEQLQPGAIDPATGQPVPPAGAPPKAEPEMTPDRASEILQPYAEGEKGPEEEEPRTESDVLWSRLGEEKDVQPDVTTVDPVTGESVVGPPTDIDPATGQPIEDPLHGGLSLEAGDGTEQADTPPELAADEGDSADEEEAATRARLRERLDMEATGVPAPVEEGPPEEELLPEELPVEEEKQRLPRERLTPKKPRPRIRL